MLFGQKKKAILSIQGRDVPIPFFFCPVAILIPEVGICRYEYHSNTSIILLRVLLNS